MDEMGKTVITPDEVKKHNIKQYNFKGLQNFQNSRVVTSSVKPEESNADSPPENFDNNPKPPVSAPTPASANSENSNFNYNEENRVPMLDKKLLEITENILKKAEGLEGNLQEMQNKMQTQQSEFSKQLEEVQKNSYENGLKEGEAQTLARFEAEINETKELFLQSIEALNIAIEDSKKVTQSFESELSGVAIDIAQEVISTEITENSKEIALALAKSLMENLKESTKITIKVNPLDFEYLQTNLQAETNVNIEANKSIRQGGVIITSDVGNVDGDVMTRFNNIKRSIKEAQGV